MASRGKEKQSLSSSLPSTTTTAAFKDKGSIPTFISSLLPKTKLLLSISVLFSLWLFLLFRCFPSSSFSFSSSSSTNQTESSCDPDIAPFYIYDLPDHFNAALLRRCRDLNIYTDMCPHVAHRGLGRPISNSWYATQQFLAEMVFHARADRHPCRVPDPLAARLFYVPFYAGLYASSQFRQPDPTLRDTLAVDLLRHLSRHPTWRRRHGRDHFLALGRTSWDFMRNDDHSQTTADFGANRLLLLPAAVNVTVLTVERHPWNGKNQYGIPYPSYFHPRTRTEVDTWQEAVRKSKRTHLFAFIGGPRPGLEKAAVREEILRQCGESDRCLRVECEPGSSACHEADRVLAVMRAAEFCLQPPGDSFTRRSVFDAVLAGCVPVFFSEHTAYTQYQWYTPARPEEWSVYIGPDRWGRIEEELGRFTGAEVDRMRARVVEMIPRVTYAHPNASRGDLGFRDAVDVALVELTKLLGPARQVG